MVYQSKRHWSNDDMCHSLTQTTSFSTDFETLQRKRDNTLNQVNASVEPLEYLCDSTVLPQSFNDKFTMCTFLQSSLKVLNKLLKVIFGKQTDSTSATMESFTNNELFTVIKGNIVYIKILKNDFVTEGKVTNPKLLDVICRVCQKVKRYIEKYLVHIKYWQILGY